MPRVSPSSPTPVWLGRLTLELKRLAAPVLASRRRGLLSLSFEVPLPPQTVPAQAQGEWFFWHRPAQGHRLLGLGLAGRITAAGSARFQALARAVALARSHWTFIHQGRANPLARAFLGFAFDPDHQPGGDWRGFPNLAFLVPQVLLEWRDGGDCTITFNHDCGLRLSPERVIATWSAQLHRLLEAEPEAQGTPPRLMSARQVPAPGRWQAQVSDALAAIRQGRLEKVVLSRTLELAFGGAPAPAPLLERLAEDFPRCAILGTSFGGPALVAATPERLLSLHGGQVVSDAIAGTLVDDDPRGLPAMEAYEHRPVVEAIRGAFEQCCTRVTVDPTPQALELRDLAHLATQVRGTLRPEADLFELLAALHPTPAVGGVPRDRALRWIAATEAHARGWYTGAFGWIGHRRRAELAVVLRCGLLDHRRLRLYAGAGITRASDPDAELEETASKFRPLLDRVAGPTVLLHRRPGGV